MYTLYLREFIDLYQTCSFQKTAENMNISISSISKHITKLEERCGVPLFDRTTRTVVPNDYGTTFFEYAQQIVDLEEKGLNALHAQRRSKSGLLTVGYMPVMLEYQLVDVLMEFMKRYPEIEVMTMVGNRCSELFETDRCDFVFFDDCMQSNLNLGYVLCKEDNLGVLLPINHPLAKEKQISIAQLKDERFIMHGNSNTSLCRDSMEVCKLCHDAGFEPNVFLASTHVSTIMSMIRKGIGVSVLMKFLCPEHLSKSVAIVDLVPTSTFRIYCLYKKGIASTPAQKLFLSFIREYSEHWPAHEHSNDDEIVDTTT